MSVMLLIAPVLDVEARNEESQERQLSIEVCLILVSAGWECMRAGVGGVVWWLVHEVVAGVGWLVGWSVGRWVGRSVGRLVGRSVGLSVGRSVARSLGRSLSRF